MISLLQYVMGDQKEPRKYSRLFSTLNDPDTVYDDQSKYTTQNRCSGCHLDVAVDVSAKAFATLLSPNSIHTASASFTLLLV